jgi:hypothetical protein
MEEIMARVTRHKKLTALIVVAMLGMAGAAYAYWSGSGNGSGTAGVGTSGNVTLVATVAPGIAPGTSRAVSFTAGNATDSPLFVDTVQLVSVTADAGHADCDMDDFTLADVNQDVQIPAGATAEALPNDGLLVFANSAVSQDACKGATLTIAVSST